jgi:hypothetical protein
MQASLLPVRRRAQTKKGGRLHVSLARPNQTVNRAVHGARLLRDYQCEQPRIGSGRSRLTDLLIGCFFGFFYTRIGQYL